MKSRAELKKAAAKLFFENWFVLVFSAAVLLIVTQIQVQVTRMQERPPEEHIAMVEATPGFELFAETLRAASETGLTVWQVLLIFQIFSILLALLSYGFSNLALKTVEGQHLSGVEVFSAYKRPLRWLAFYFIYTIKVLLWSLLFIVPGIIAAISYSQAVFLMIEDEELSPFAAIKKSSALMRGRQMEYFIMIMSFLGFYILAFFTMWITTLYSDPYIRMTLAGYYKELIAGQTQQQQQQPAETMAA